MNLPFDRSQFFDVMAAYNEAVWPVQVGLTAAAVGVAWLALRRTPNAGRWASAFLAVLWAWSALAYHWAFFTRINPAAWVFGGVFLAGALVFAWSGVLRHGIRFDPHPGAAGVVGGGLIVFALAVYPAVGRLAGHDYPAAPTFGLPCPTTLFTVGTLMLTTSGTPRLAYVAPVLWAVIGASAALLFGVYQDLALLVAGLAAAWRWGAAGRAGGGRRFSVHRAR